MPSGFSRVFAAFELVKEERGRSEMKGQHSSGLCPNADKDSERTCVKLSAWVTLKTQHGAVSLQWDVITM